MFAHPHPLRCPKPKGGLRRLLTLCMAFSLQACSTAPSQRLATLAPLVDDRSDVYVYRVSEGRNAVRAVTLSVDGRAIGRDLCDGSYSALRLAPGRHRLGIDMKWVAHNVALDIDVPTNSASFFELDLSGIQRPVLIASWSPHWTEPPLSRPPLTPRSTHRALADLAELDSTHPDGGFLTLEQDAAYAAVDDVEAVPGLSATDRERYREWLRLPHPRAAVIADGGRLFLSTHFPGPIWSGPQLIGGLAANWTFVDCRWSGATGCRIYAQDDRVVWTRRP